MEASVISTSGKQPGICEVRYVDGEMEGDEDDKRCVYDDGADPETARLLLPDGSIWTDTISCSCVWNRLVMKPQTRW